MRLLNKRMSLVIGLTSVMAFSAGAGKWTDHHQKRMGLKSKIAQNEEKLYELILAKKHTHDAGKLKAILDEMRSLHEDYEKSFKNLAEVERHIRFKHPAKGEEVELHAFPDKAKSMVELENEVGIDSKLSDLKIKVRKIYGLAPPPEEIKRKKEEEKKERLKPKKLHLVK